MCSSRRLVAGARDPSAARRHPGAAAPGVKGGVPTHRVPTVSRHVLTWQKGPELAGAPPSCRLQGAPPTASCWGCRDGMGRWPARSQGRPEPGVAGARGGQASCVSGSEGVCRSRWLRGEHGPSTAPAGQAGWVGAGGEHVRGPSFRAARPAPRMPAPPGPAASSWVWGKELRPPRLGRCSVPGS